MGGDHRQTASSQLCHHRCIYSHCDKVYFSIMLYIQYVYSHRGISLFIIKKRWCISKERLGYFLKFFLFVKWDYVYSCNVIRAGHVTIFLPCDNDNATTRQCNTASGNSQGPEKSRKIVRPQCLDGVATTNIVKWQLLLTSYMYIHIVPSWNCI